MTMDVESTVEDMDEEHLLEHLADQPLQPPQSDHSLFDALDLLDNEKPYSDLLAWLLTPRGPLTDGWLLDAVVDEFTSLNDQVGRQPQRVVREYGEADHGRPDITIEWSSTTLIIENKVHSSEGDNQCAKYVDGLDDGELIYLTLQGSEPSSVDVDTAPVEPVGYGELADLITNHLSEEAEPDARGRTLARECARSMNEVAGRRLQMEDLEKPEPTDATRTYFEHADKLERLEQQAKEESADIIQWTARRMLKAIRESAESSDIDMHRRSSEYAWIFRPPNWVHQGCQFGLCYSTESNLGNDVLSGYSHLIGIGCRRIEEVDQSIRRELSKSICRFLWENWPEERAIGQVELKGRKDDLLSSSNSYWPFYLPYSASSFREGEDWEAWSERMTDLMVDMWSVFGERLEAFSENT